MLPPDTNVLGRGLLDAALEARLVARGIVFAEFVPRANGRGVRLTTSTRPIDRAVADVLLDAVNILGSSSLITA